jgi:TRAP-type mannitol/chloroaromatic compound transport system permease small subunit
LKKLFTKVTQIINLFTDGCGKGIAWLILLMVLIQCLVVCLRYLFDIGSIALQESVNYIHACCFMLGAAFTYKENTHVRVDIFYRKMSEKNKHIVNIFGNLVFLIPLCIFILIITNDYVLQSWRIQERSADSEGLSYVYILKTLIPLMALTLFIQGLADTYKSFLLIRNKKIGIKSD